MDECAGIIGQSVQNFEKKMMCIMLAIVAEFLK